MDNKKIRWAPYLLILPTTIYLAVFFAYPMVKALQLAVTGGGAKVLSLREAPSDDADAVGLIPLQTEAEVLETATEAIVLESGRTRDKYWYKIEAETVDGEVVEGWAPFNLLILNKKAEAETNVPAEPEEADNGIVAGGDITDPDLTNGEEAVLAVRADPEADADAAAYLPVETAFVIDEADQVDDQYWFYIQAEDADGETVEGWVPLEYLTLQKTETRTVLESASRTEVTDIRISDGDTRQGGFTTEHIERMVNDSKFREAMVTTILLILAILPIQFILAIVMALLLQSRLKGSSIFLYIFAIPLGISDLAAGLIWYSIFQQSGYLNTVLEGLGLIDQQATFISADNRYTWVFLAIVLAEVWRATSIVMVIVVSGLQAIPDSLVEAGQVFGANMWQRIRFIILPLLMPSLQVALILRTILAFQVFAVVIALSGTRAVTTVLARETFFWYDPSGFNNPNVAAAYAGLIMILSLGFALLYLRMITSREQQAA